MSYFSGAVPVLDVVARLVVAVVLGGLIGWNRERLDKPAGLRTHMMVTLGSAAFVLLALDLSSTAPGVLGTQGMDPTRVIQGVAGGIGFLGAGSIIQSRGEVSGVTTASGIWVAGALGVACALGAYEAAITIAIISLLVLGVLGRLERRLKAKSGQGGAP